MDMPSHDDGPTSLARPWQQHTYSLPAEALLHDMSHQHALSSHLLCSGHTLHREAAACVTRNTLSMQADLAGHTDHQRDSAGLLLMRMCLVH